MACDKSDDSSRVDAGRTESGARVVDFDQETDSVTETIVTTVADMADTSPGALDPLYSVIDPDALDAIIRSVATKSDPSDAKIVVRYHGFTITIHSYGVLEIHSENTD